MKSPTAVPGGVLIDEQSIKLMDRLMPIQTNGIPKTAPTNKPPKCPFTLLRYLAFLSEWNHSFSRLFTLIRAALWKK